MTFSLSSSMPDISFTRLTFHLKALEPIALPPFSGSVFRGGFGAALRRACCAHSGEECSSCILSPSCIYSMIFETGPAHVKGGKYQLSQYPRPFVLEPPLTGKKTFQAGLERFTPHTITDPNKLRQELAKVRERGYALAQEELEEGLNVVAGPIYDYTGQVVASVSVAGPAYRVTPEMFPELASQLMDTAPKISEQLGYKPE